MIEIHEIEIARHCISFACANGADSARVNLNKSGIDGCNMLNGELDKVTHAADRSIYLYLFVKSNAHIVLLFLMRHRDFCHSFPIILNV